MQVKIVILNWNGAAHLRRFLPGVVATTPADAEVVVADNGSTDDSVELLRREFPTVRLLLLDRNYGYAGGYNWALEQLEGDCFVLLNSDVETPAGWLEPLVAALEADPGVAAVAPKLRALNEPEKFEYAGAAGGYIDYLGYPFCRGRILGYTEVDKGQYDDARDLFWVSGAAFCCRAEVFRKLGGFDAWFFAHMEEIDLCWRMQLAGYRIRIVPQSTVYHLGGGTLAPNSPRKIYFNHRNNLAMLLKCTSPVQRIPVLLLRPLLDLLAAFSYLLQGHGKSFCSVFKAYRDFLRHHGDLLRQRREIRRTAVRRQVTGIWHGSMLLRYLFGGRTFGRMC